MILSRVPLFFSLLRNTFLLVLVSSLTVSLLLPTTHVLVKILSLLFVLLRVAISLPLSPSSLGRWYNRAPYPDAYISLSRLHPLSLFLSLSLSLDQISRLALSTSRVFLYAVTDPAVFARRISYRTVTSPSPTLFSRRRSPGPPRLSRRRLPRAILVRPATRRRDCYARLYSFSLVPPPRPAHRSSNRARAGYPIILDSRRSGGSVLPLLSLRRALEYRHPTAATRPANRTRQ